MRAFHRVLRPGSLRSQLLAIVLIAIGYYVSGRLGLLLAIPPGYATAVWPASGIALAGILLAGRRAWPGIWIGSVCINVSNGFSDTSPGALLQSLLLPGFIAAGATLQALIGALVVRRLRGERIDRHQELHNVWVLMLGGPLSCTLSATIGVATLYARGLVPEANLIINWWTWWVGDTIGVLIFTPLVLLWAQRPFRAELGRRLQITVPMVAMFVTVVALFIFISGQEQARLDKDFQARCRDYMTRFERDLRDDLQALRAVSTFVAENEDLDRMAFERFAGRQLELLAGVRSLSWVEQVSDRDRAAFEQKIQAQGFPDYRIRERGPDGELRVAAVRANYAPVTYIVPREGNTLALGFDDRSEPVRAAALERARRSGLAEASGRIGLVQDDSQVRGMLIVLAQSAPGGSERGYVVAAVRSDQLIGASVDGLADEGIELSVTEVDHGRSVLLYGAAPSMRAGGLRADLPMTIGGRVWTLHFVLTPEYLLAHRSWAVWTLLAGGMLFTGLLGLFLLVVIGRGLRIERLVERRTAELAASNRELEQFAYAVSHDLQAPLRGISSFAGLLDKRCREQLSEDGREFLGYIRESATEMACLIEDLLQLSRVNAQRADIGRTSSAKALERACELLRADLEACGARIDHGPMPEVRADGRWLTQLFQNLISNAIKFRREGYAPQLRIASSMHDGIWRFELADNGIGIAEENLPRIFQIFKRLHTAEQYPGNGIGLALCKKIVTLHGGKIWVQSQLGVGTSIFFTLAAPLRDAEA